MTTNYRALIIDQDHTFPVEVCRALGRRGFQVDVFARPISPAFRSRYCTRRIVAPPWETAPFPEAVLETVTKGSYDVILMCDEEILETMLPVVDASDAWRGLLLPEREQLLRTFSKNTVLEVAQAVGVPVPRTLIPNTAADVVTLGLELAFPLVVKGEKGGGSYNVRVVRTPEELVTKFEEIATRERVYGGRTALQEYLPGPTYLFGGLFHNGTPLRICAHRKALMYPPGHGTTAKAVTERPPELVEYGCRVMHAFRYTGFGDLDFIRDSRDGQFKLLELNPRLWASVGLAEHAGVDFYEPYLRLAQGKSVEPDLRYREGVAFHLLAKEVQLMMKQPSRVLGFLRDCLDPRVVSDLDWRDLGPLRALFGAAFSPEKELGPHVERPFRKGARR